MSSMNRASLIGNLGRDPESRTTQGGTKVVTFSVATSTKWTDRATGETKENTQWHRIVIWNERLGDVAERYLKKGSKVMVEGSIESRKFIDTSGAERETTEIILRPFHGNLILLGDRQEGSASGSGASPRQQESTASRPQYAHRAAGAGARTGRHTDLDDDIPFAAQKD